MLVREIMTSSPMKVHAEDDLDTAIAVMAERKVTMLPVVDEHDRVVGVLSEVDVLRRAIEPDARAHMVPLREAEPLPSTVGEIMTPSPSTTSENTDVNDLVGTFLSQGFKSLPVAKGGKLVGVISRSDVIQAFWRSDEELLHDVTAAFLDQDLSAYRLSVDRGVVEVIGPNSVRDAGLADAVARSVLGVRRVHIVDPMAESAG
jgi:CBS domain-containing protein